MSVVAEGHGPVAVFGGTFDPIHHAHLRVALEAGEALDAHVHMIPAAVPPHREQPLANARQRLAMLELALAGQQRLLADPRELERDGASYTVDTLASLRADYGPARPLVLLLGADAFAGLSTWHRWREIFSLAHVVALTRPGHGGVFEAELAGEWYTRRVGSLDELGASPAGRCAPLEVTALEISASAVREAIARGGSARYLVPAAVDDYIRRHALYGA
ncbi:MAG TPA: nicotinate-nucleotide adenylyltransferase [Xanthomonadales bacterium]|nr:nicotinate-nucleotide adenylyltransferase [Xanthomonadales bacterium]